MRTEKMIIAQQKEVKQLKEENRLLGEMITYKNIIKLKEENKALLGVIEGMKLIIKNLEDERNRQNNNTK